MDRLKITAKLILPVLLFTLSCNKNQEAAHSAQSPTGRADLLGSEVLAPEGFSNELTQTPGQLTLPISFGRRTADLDQMLKKRNIRALVTINPISFFYSHGHPRGMLYEQLEQLERFVNKKYKTRRGKVRISFIPMRPDELGPALSQGVGDFVASWIVVTPGRQKHYAFTSPILTDVKQIVVTGPERENAKSLDDMVGTDIYVSPLTSFYEHLMQLNEERVKAGKAQLSVKPADKNLQEDDLVEMVNAGLIPATVAMAHRANLWEQILPNVKVHPDMVIASEGELAWVMRKSNPQLKQLLDQFTETHGEGTLFGNILLRRYLKNADWVKNSNSTEEMKKFATYLQYFKKYAADYHFDYLMLIAQGYQESRLDQNKRSPRGAIGIMQVMPKYASAPPINVPDVSRADRNILAGVRILDNIATNYFNDPAIDDVNKTLFTFASYNAGPSRMVRLSKKAAQDGLNPNKWFGNVELEVAQEVGEETVLYVDNVYKYYIAYKLATERGLELQNVRAAN